MLLLSLRFGLHRKHLNSSHTLFHVTVFVTWCVTAHSFVWAGARIPDSDSCAEDAAASCSNLRLLNGGAQHERLV